MSTHSTFVGVNLFKDQSDKIDINPRADQKGGILAIVGSATLLLEINDIRNRFEGLGLDREGQELRTKKSGLRSSYSLQTVK